MASLVVDPSVVAAARSEESRSEDRVLAAEVGLMRQLEEPEPLPIPEAISRTARSTGVEPAVVKLAMRRLADAGSVTVSLSGLVARLPQS